MSMLQKKRNNRRKQRNNAFVPDSEYIESAVNEFLNNGGRIERIEFVEKSADEICADKYCGADSFLLGEL